MANTFIFDDDEQPDMGGGMTPEQDDEQPPEEGEGNNRTFYIILGVIVGLLVLAVLCVGGFWLINSNNARAALVATDTFATQQVSSTQTEEALLANATFTPTPIVTETPTTTPVVVIFATETLDAELPTVDPDMATVAVQQTQLAETQQAQQVQSTATARARGTGTPGRTGTAPAGGAATPTAKIPQTGFADEVGLPALGILTVILLGIILLARRLRAAPGR